MTSIFRLFGEIAIRNEEANKAITDTTNHAQQSGGRMNAAFSKMGKGAVACGKVIASGLAVAGAAMGALLKSSIGEYAEYEQLVGGVETLFKESKGKVMGYANEAYKTAGMSANQYMETVTGFSASLLQGLSGDTELAAEYANMAITDMADNANKMGTSMDSIQNAYQGFAKQNYTMLDNLKLGYGGTQSEMARLINDSGVLGSAITVTAETVNQVPFDKVIKAIHVVQDEMGITGTTAKEASETISGSFSTFKSTWRNLMTGLASGDQDINVLFGNVVDSGKTLARNIISVLPTIGRNIKTLLISAGQLIDNEMNNNVWPSIQDWFKLNFDIEMPDWETFKTNVSTWWTDTVTKISDICSWTLKVFGIAEWTEEDSAAMQAWWDGVYEKIVDICQWFFNPQLPDAETVINDIMAWWENVKKNIRLVLGITVQRGATINAHYAAQENTAAAIGDVVAAQYGETAGALAEQNVLNFANNSDSFVNWGSVWNALTDWNAEGAIFDKPTIFNTRLGLQGVGEAGAEAVAPISKLQEYISSAVQSTVGGMQFNIVLDSGALVGQLAPKMDTKLGTISGYKGRGN